MTTIESLMLGTSNSSFLANSNTQPTNLHSLSPKARKLINEVAGNPSLFKQFVEDRLVFWEQFGFEIDQKERRVLELFAEIFLPGNALVVVGQQVQVDVYGWCWTDPKPQWWPI